MEKIAPTEETEQMSINLGRFFGTNLLIHWTFWLLPLWVFVTHVQNPGEVPLALHLALLGALFACVVLHEYGHALTARLFGIRTRDITLYPIGGVARLERMSEKPWEEFWIAIAGPLVNVALAAILGLGFFAGALVWPGFVHGTLAEFLFLLVAMNLVLFGFNLVPAFPMDGGRVLRALLTLRLGRVRATRAAVGVSIGVIAITVLCAVTAASWNLDVPFLNNPWLIFIGLFVILAGLQELAAVEIREQQRAAHTDWELPETLPNAAANVWRGFPGKPVTVYVWDGRKNAWIAQGVVPGHVEGGRRPFA